ncbi:MAG TPA: hypothetical protein DEV93_14595 [Chloroflexi bacterium]|jgi:hypothetical protein|nr:hypothetical protein [Chloroflexota bacterium]
MDDARETTKSLRFLTHAVEWVELNPIQLRQHMAVHEAGHAVVGIAHDMSLLDVDIQSDPVSHPDGGFIFGGIRFDAPNGDMNEWARERPVETAIVLMAGKCAEELILGSHLRESWSGDLRILRIGHGWLEGMSDLPHEMFRYLNDAHDAVTRHETTIRRVADVLLRKGRLTADEVAHLTGAFGRER